jgi:predicted transposase YdaD
MKPTEDEVCLVRNFAENSVKFLLLNRDNAREALTLMAPGHAPLIDFSRMEVLRTTFVAPDFRHLETDLLLKAPMRGRRGKGERPVYVYQLIEHQSEPDDHAVYRAIRYVMQVFELQAREWRGKPRDLRFDPVLPVLIYTGTRSWARPSRCTSW